MRALGAGRGRLGGGGPGGAILQSSAARDMAAVVSLAAVLVIVVVGGASAGGSVRVTAPASSASRSRRRASILSPDASNDTRLVATPRSSTDTDTTDRNPGGFGRFPLRSLINSPSVGQSEKKCFERKRSV